MEMPLTVKYTMRPVTNCDLSQTPLEEAAPFLGPSFFYELYVHPNAAAYARRLIREWGAEHLGHPFAPAINLHVDLSLGRDEWYITANGNSYGSPGA